ncbi:MAG TPA: hypothetical protein ENJ00_08145 [Phycisphaerales bacterium]|nr:hypothetical protein [Phycisphaerales bacterium]
MKLPFCIGAAAMFAGAAVAQPTVLGVDPVQSSIDLTITLDTALGSRTDSDSSTITGQMTIELDSYTAPTTMTLIDYNFVAGPLAFTFDYGFLGTINATADNLSLGMPAGSVPVTGPVDGSGMFMLDNVPNQTTGIVNVSGTGVVGSAVGNSTTDLSTVPQDPIQIIGMVAVNAGTVTVTIDVPLAGTNTDPDTGVTVTFSGTATVVASGPVPPPVCLADTNHDGVLTPADFTSWIAAFNSGASECDQNGDGSCDPTDFTAWIANFNAGCSG